jgi:hypothetical protein
VSAERLLIEDARQLVEKTTRWRYRREDGAERSPVSGGSCG